MLLNCESQFSTYHVITNKATAVSCTTITRPPQSSAGIGESPEMLKKSYAYLDNLSTFSRGLELMEEVLRESHYCRLTSYSSC